MLYLNGYLYFHRRFIESGPDYDNDLKLRFLWIRKHGCPNMMGMDLG